MPALLMAQVEPRYTSLARINNAELLKERSRQTITQIADLAQHHPNTVTRILSGKSGAILTVHHIFTAVNVATSNGYRRSEYMRLIVQKSREELTEPAWENCLVFPNLSKLASRANLRQRDILDEAGVPAHYGHDLFQGVPASENLVRAVFDVMFGRTGKVLRAESELFN